MGNFRHNLDVIKEGKGELIVARRSPNMSCPDDFLPCIFCLGFFKAVELWRHARNCHFNSEPKSHGMTKSTTAQAKLLLAGGLSHVKPGEKDDFDTHIISTMRRNDDVCEAVKNDILIRRFGNVLLNKLGIRRKNDISQRVRQLGKLKCTMGLSNKSQLLTHLSGTGFDKIIKAVHTLCGLSVNEQRIKTFEIPSLALRLGHNLVKCAMLKRGMGLRDKDALVKGDANDFLELHQGEWTDSVSSIALATLKTNKFNKNELLPLTSDVVLLKCMLEGTMIQLTDALAKKATDKQQSTVCYPLWRKLCEVTYAHITIFNKRRASEVAELLVTSYTTRPQWTESPNQEFLKTLDAVETQLLKR